MANKPPDNFFKVLQALQYACQKTAPCIKKVVDSWHSQEQPKQQPCRQPQACSGIKGKPKLNSSCRECINWGKAVEGAHYPQPPQIAWRNIDTSLLHTNAIEVCNGFALHLPSGQRPTKMVDYDTASILKIMMGFGLFHQSNQGTAYFPQPYQTIQKVSSIRNNLSHYPMDKQLSMDDLTMQQNFQDINDFVQCLVDLQHVTQREADDIKAQLDQILKSPSQLTLEMERVITDVMKEGFHEHQDQTTAIADVLEKMISEVDSLKQEIHQSKQLAQDMQEAHGVDIDRLREDMSETKGETQEILEAHGAEISSLKDDVDQLKTDTHQEEIKRREENVAIWRNKLKDKYLKERKKIRFGKGNQEIADIDDIFVDLSISVSPKNSNVRRANIHKCYKPFESYVDLLHLKTAEDKPHHHILLSGVAGSGKTTLLSRIACDWAKEVETTGAQQSSTLASDAGDSSWSKFKLLLLLDIKKIKPDTSLEQAIKNQLLPGVPEEDIERVMSNLKGSCLVLLDGFDEVQAGVDTNDSALCSPLLGTCFVIVTSRPHMVDYFCSISSGYAIIWLSGFSWKNSLLYIQRFFREQEHLGNRFIEKVKSTPLLRALSPFPILLVMMCILWEHSQRKETAFKSLTGLYQQAVVYLNKPFRRPTPFIENLDSILEALGKPGLTSLFNNNLQIDKSAFNDETILKKSFHMGLAYEEECPGETVVYFIHKTFQEFCSAKYLVSLAESDHSLFESHLKNIDETNVLALQYLLQFSCGLNFKAAVMIFSHVVNLLSTKPNDEYQNHWSLPLRLLYEMETNDSHSSNNQQMHPLLKQLADHNLIVHLRDRDLSYILSHFIETDKHSPDSWLRYVKYLIINNYGNDNIEASMFSKYLEHMDSVEKLILSYVKLIGAFDFQCYRTIKEVELSSCTIPTSMLVRLLSCMPALQQVAFESVNFEGSIDSVVPIQCASIEKFAMSKCSVDANAMLKLISCLPIRNIYLWQNNFRDETDIDGSLSCPAIHKFTMSYGENCIHGSELAVKPNSSTALKFFSCMDSLNELTLQCVDISGKLSKQMNELSQLNISGSYSEYCKVNAHTLMSSISNMDGLQTFSLENASIVGDLLDRDKVATLPASCRVMMRKVQGSACTFVILLNCMKSAKTVSLESLELSGKFDPLISISTGHNSQQVMKLTKIIEYSYITFGHNILQGRKSNVNAQALLNHLQRLPNVQEVDLDRINVSGELQADNTEDCTLFKSLSIKSGTIRAETMMRMMGRMPSLEKLHLGVRLKEEDMLCENPARLKSLKVANISRLQNARTLLTFIACMPSLETLTTWGLFLGEIRKNIPVKCESLENFDLYGIPPTNEEERLCSIPSTVVANILQCMPFLKILRLWFVKLIGRLGFVDDPCSSTIILAKLQQFVLFEGEICADTLMTFLCSSPVLRRVVVSRVNVVGELSAKSVKPCPSITEFDMEGSTVDVTTLLAYLECMPSLQKLDLGNVVNLSTSEAPQECNSIETFRMDGVTIDASVLMLLLSHMPSLVKVVLNRMILKGASQGALECRSVEGFTMSGGSVDTGTLLWLLGSMVPLKQVVLNKVEMQEELQENVLVCCNALETFNMKDMEVTVSTLARILHHTPSLKTLQVSRIKGEIEPGIKVSCSELQLIKILSEELSVSKLAGVLSCIPSVQAILCQNVNIMGDMEVSVSLKCVTSLVLIDCTLEEKIFCWLVSLMPSLKAVSLKSVDLQGEETGTIRATFKRLGEIHISNMGLKTSFISQFLNHTPALQNIQLGAICFEEDAIMNIPTTFNDLTEFTIKESKFSALILQRFLRSMPLVSKLILEGVSIIGEMDQSLSVTCKSVIDFRMSGTSNSAPLGSNTLSHILACLPALQSICLDKLHLQLVTDHFKTTIGQSVKKIDIRSGEVDPNAMLRIMSCMPILETVKFEHVDFTNEVNYTVDSQQLSLKCLNLTKLKDSLSIVFLLRLLNYMPFLEQIRIDSQFHLLGELDLERVRPCNQLMMAFFWSWYRTNKFNIETVVKFLAHCAPSIERVILDNVEHVGEFDGPLSVTCASLRELTICSKNSSIAKPWTISINALVKALHCLPSLQLLELGLLDITGDLDASVPKLTSGIKSFLMTGGSLSSSVLSVLLECLPVVENMVVQLTDQADVTENVCRSLKTLDLSASSDIKIQANTVVGFVGVMPALEELKLGNVDSEDTVHDNILVNGKTIRSLCLKKCSLTADGLIRLLRHMKRLERITLDGVNINNKTDTERILEFPFVEDLNMKSGSISAGAIMKLLCCMPHICKVTLCMLTDEASDRNVKCDALRELTVSQSNLGVRTVTILMQCMPSLQKLVMDKVNIAGQVDVDIAYELRFLRIYEMNESTISAGVLLMFVHLMPGLKTVKLCAVQITGELNDNNAAPCKSVQSFSLSARSSNQFASATEKQTCSVNATALFGLLGCMVDLVELDLDKVEVVGELSADIQIRCHKLEKIMMKGGSVSAKAIMMFLEHTHAVSKITLGRTVGEVEVNLNRSTKLMLVKELVLQQYKNTGIFSGEKIIRFLRIMPTLEKVSIRVPELGIIETAEDIRCMNLKELEIAVFQSDAFISDRQHGTIEANSVLKFSDISPCLETLILKQVEVRGALQTEAICQPFESLTDLLMIAVSITPAILVQYLTKMPALERLSLVKMNIVGLFETNTPIAFRCLKIFNLSGNKKPLKVSAKMVAMMSSLIFLRIEKFELVGDFDCNMTTLGTSLTDVHLSDGTIGTVSFFQYLLTLPSLKKLYLSKIPKLLLPGNVSIKSLEEITLRLLKATILVPLLQHMPCVRKRNMQLCHVEIEEMSQLHVKFDAVKEFNFKPGLTHTSDANSIAQLLHHMPLLEKVVLQTLNMSGDLSVCNDLNWKSLKEFHMWLNSSAKANTAMRLVRKMPALEILRLENIRGALDVAEFGLWKSLKKLLLLGATINTGTFLKLLRCMPVLEILTVRVTLDGNADASYSLNSILEFNMNGSKSSIAALMSVVDCMPALRKLTLEDVQVEGRLDENRSEMGVRLAELSLVRMKLKTSTCIGMLGRMKALKTVSLQEVQLEGVVHSDQYSVCQSVKELQIGNRNGAMDANIPLLLMNCMPSLEKMTLENTYCGKVDLNIHPQCKELRELCLCYASMDTNTFVRYINCMPALQIVNSVRLTGDWDEGIEITIQSIKEFSCSIVNRVRFLEAFLPRQQALTKFKLKSTPDFENELSTSDKKRVLAVVNSVSSSLKCLELDGIAPVSYKLPDHLKTMLASCLPNLQELRFSNTNMTEMQCDKFLEMFISTADTAVEQRHSHALPLQWLDLSGSEISDSVGKLAQVLIYMRNLRGLHLSSCSLEERHCQDLSPLVASLNHLMVLDLSDNQGVSSIIIASRLSWLKHIKVLKLSGAGIKDEDLTCLPLGEMCGLTELDLSNNPIGDAGLETLLDSVDQEGPFTCNEDIKSDATDDLSSDSDSIHSDSDDSFLGAVSSHQSMECSQPFLPNYLVGEKDEEIETLMHSVDQEGHFSSDEGADSDDNDRISSSSCNSCSDDSFVSAVTHLPCSHHALKKLSFRDCKSIGTKGVERLFRDLLKFPKLAELDMAGIYLPTYECMHSPRLCSYLKAAGGLIMDGDNNLFYKERLSLYDADQIKSIKNCSVGE